MSLKFNIKELREAKGLTQQELSELTGIPRGRINAWEQRNVTPSKMDDIEKLKKVFQFETNVPRETNSKEEIKAINSLSTEAILELARSNTKLAEANKDMAQANKVLADNNSDLIKMLKDAPNSTQTYPGYVSAILQPYLQQLAAGLANKKLNTADAVMSEFYKILGGHVAGHEKSGKHG